MPRIEFSPREIARSKIVGNDWFRVKIDSVGEARSKDGGSINYPVEATIIKNAETGSEEFTGVPLMWNFNSKAIGFAVGFLQALGVEVEASKRYDLKDAEGMELEVFVETGEYNGNLRNQVNHKYRAVTEKREAVTA